MARNKMTHGICRLCRTETMLSFEHIPPKSAFNKGTLCSMSLEFNNTELHLKRGKTKQGGIGDNSLCRDCNSFLGTNYVPSYTHWAEIGKQQLDQSATFAKLEYVARDIDSLKIIKQIISMFIAINSERFSIDYPELSAFVRSPDSQDLSDRFRVYMHLTKESKCHYIPFGAAISGEFGKPPLISTSILFPPYGYILTIDRPEPIDQRKDITSFSQGNPNSKTSVLIHCYQLQPTEIPSIFQTSDIGKV